MQEKIKKFLILSKSYLRKLFTGRLNRKNFFLSWLIIFSLLSIFLSIFSVLIILFGGDIDNIFSILGIVLLLILGWVILCSLLVRRAHDFNAPAWNGIILIFIPFGFLYLLFKKGDTEANKYGNLPEHKFNFFKIILNK
jgi:uncharacterized membrane protein YhaH (DUF805 family)